ncbi:RPM1-interacting protein 4 (RIN4) family protein [Actinidia rufa]|uniref:RPM1-interacting protein 4 (RIN4) family protein n=1 Tax=Actinidia rufa TaxID=165716 RepID=A0A7J0DBL6_9ERIC|nr:RPM1-interacting protein 4 (RIN4) family protein [Actinidia rufa]
MATKLIEPLTPRSWPSKVLGSKPLMCYQFLSWDKGRPLPKFGEWDVNDPASAEGFTVIFNKARDEKKTGGKPESPTKADSNLMHGADPIKPQSVSRSLLIHCAPIIFPISTMVPPSISRHGSSSFCICPGTVLH